MLPSESTDCNTNLAARWADAETKVIGSIVGPLGAALNARERRINLVADVLAMLVDHHWSTPRNAAIYGAICRLAHSGTLPLAGPLESELRRCGNGEAADYVAERATYMPGDAAAEYWAAQAAELGRIARIYIEASRITSALDAGQTVRDIRDGIDQLAAEAAGHEPEAGILSASELVESYPNLRPYVVEGLLRAAETANLISSPKIGKSWLLLGLLLSVAIGGEWLGRRCAQGRVLLIDNELHRETLATRLAIVADAMGIRLADTGDNLHIRSLRGKPENIDTLGRFFRQCKPGDYSVVALDALYRSLPPNCEENSNEDMRAVYNTIDAYAESTGAAFLLVHHSSKGLQNEKSVTDVGSGAGAIARAADVHLIVRAHEDADCAVLECRVRSSAQPDPVGLRWAYPLWTPDPAIDVTRLAAKPRRPKRAEIADDRGTPGYMAVVSCATADPRPLGWFSARATAGKDHVARSLLRQACAVGALHLWPAKTARHPDRWALAPPTLE